MARVFQSYGLLSVVFLAACGGGTGRENDSSIFADDDEGVSLGSSSTDEGISTVGDEGTKLDMPTDETGMTSATAEGGEAPSCAAIDFLFVIDNSGSMGDNQQALIASFPGFIQKIQQAIGEVDSYHIMVVDTDAYWNDCTIECAFFPNMCQFGDVNACDGAPTVCDEMLGGGVNFPVGSDASNMYCDLTGGQRYITPQEPFASLPDKFTCIGQVGTDGDSDEKPLQALTAAVSPEFQGPGGCNTGFLRDDAVLVLTIITDEEDGSLGTPAGLFQNIVAQKGGHPENVVVLGLINDGELPNPICPPEATAPRIVEFMSYFPYSVRGSICDLNYAPFFEQAVDVINTSCDEYVPIG